MQIRVEPIWEFLTNSDKYTKILSIQTPFQSEPDTIKKIGENHLILYINDIDRRIVDKDKIYEPPSKEEVLRGLEFAKTWKADDIVLIHCHAGISRSPAMAFGIVWYLTSFNKQETLKIMDQMCKDRIPNKAIMQIWRDYFKDFPF